MLDRIKKDNQGFTIIEVLIVLAIAGLIMLIVFLAVPALQRNSRNTQRSNDAARIAGAINECLANNNGNLTSCAPASGVITNYLDATDNQQLITQAAAPTTDAFTYTPGQKCDGNTPTATGAGGRSFVITYQVETSGATVVRCVGS